jgi:hypothetical protein
MEPIAIEGMRISNVNAIVILKERKDLEKLAMEWKYTLFSDDYNLYLLTPNYIFCVRIKEPPKKVKVESKEEKSK